MTPLSYSQTLVDRDGSIMEELNALSLLCALTLPPLAAFSAYWAGFNKGKREGWHAGRSLMRIPMNTNR